MSDQNTANEPYIRRQISAIMYALSAMLLLREYRYQVTVVSPESRMKRVVLLGDGDQ